MKYYCFTLNVLIILLIPSTLSAQQDDFEWSWATRGGGSRALSNGSISHSDVQKVYNIAIDDHNNYYFVAQIGRETSPGTEPTFGNTPNDSIVIPIYDTYPYGYSRKTYLVSTTCDGDFRWHKSIGGAGRIYAKGLKVDADGGVYMAGNVFQSGTGVPLHYDQDSIKSTISEKNIYLIKYDTLGNFQWLREPQTSVTDPELATSGEIYVEPDGTIHWMVVLAPNANLENGAIMAQDNYFPPTGTQVGDVGVIRYDKNGNFLGYTRLDMDMFGYTNHTIHNIGFTYAAISQRYYITVDTYGGDGHKTIIDGQEVTGLYYLATFDKDTGNVSWWHEHNGIYNNWPRLRDVTVDDSGSIYVVGSYFGGDAINDYCEFAGHAFETGTGGPFCMKLDNNGQILWVSYPAEANRAGESIAVGEDGVFLGQGYGTFGGGGHYWDDVYFNRPSGHGADPAVIHLDKATGEALQIYDIMGSGYGDDDEITAVAMDKLGNVVVGGYMTSPWLFDNHPVVPQMDKKSPNPSDFFIAKLGKDGVSCEDEWMAVKKAADTEIKLWPNPTKGKLHIEIDGVINDIEVFDVTGRISLSNQSVENGTKSTVLDLTALPAGIYFIRISTSGHQKTFKVIKE